jgi:hypothetical protein
LSLAGYFKGTLDIRASWTAHDWAVYEGRAHKTPEELQEEEDMLLDAIDGAVERAAYKEREKVRLLQEAEAAAARAPKGAKQPPPRPIIVARQRAVSPPAPMPLLAPIKIPSRMGSTANERARTRLAAAESAEKRKPRRTKRARVAKQPYSPKSAAKRKQPPRGTSPGASADESSGVKATTEEGESEDGFYDFLASDEE